MRIYPAVCSIFAISLAEIGARLLSEELHVRIYHERELRFPQHETSVAA